MKQSCVFRQWDRKKAYEKDVIGCQDKHEGRRQYFHHSVIERVKNSQLEWNLSTNSLGVPISSRGGISRGRVLVSGCWRRACKGVCELERGEGKYACIGDWRRKKECLLENSSSYLHCCRFKAGFGPSCTLEAFSKGRLWGERVAGYLPSFRRSSMVAERELWEAFSSLLLLQFGGFPLCQKNSHLQLYPVRHISSAVCI